MLFQRSALGSPPMKYVIVCRFQPSICAWCIHEVSIVSFLESLIQNNKDILGPHQMCVSIRLRHSGIHLCKITAHVSANRIEVNLLMEDIKGSINKSDEFLNLWKLRKVEEDNFYTPFFLLVIETALKAGSSEFIALEVKLYNNI